MKFTIETDDVVIVAKRELVENVLDWLYELQGEWHYKLGRKQQP